MDSKWLFARLLGFVLLANLLFGLYLILETPSSPSPQQTHSIRLVEFKPADYMDSKPWAEYERMVDSSKSHEGILNDPEYCEKVAAFRTRFPLGPIDASGLPQREDRIVFSDYKPGNLVKDAIKKVAKLTLQSHFMDRPHSDYKELASLDPSILLFHHKTPQWHLYHRISTEFLCAGQRYNHLPGHEHMVYKDQMAKLNKRYGERFTERKDCFDPWKFMPETINLAKEEECTEAFQRLKGQPDDGEIRWIKKKARNSHNAAGVEIVTKEVQSELLLKYDSGRLCGRIRDHYILQHYISDPLLLDNKKFDFRVYMLVASMDPLMVLYHDGFLRVSLVDFDTKSNDTMAHVTNTQLAKNKLESEHASDDEYSETMSKQMWTFATFESFMISQGLVSEHWLDTYVRPTMQTRMLHLVRMSYDHLLKHPGVYELFGVDFMFDSQLNLWFLEVNRSPAMQATTEEKGHLQERMLEEVIEIELSLVKGDIDSAVERSGFTWVIDERKKGTARFHGLLKRDCL